MPHTALCDIQKAATQNANAQIKITTTLQQVLARTRVERASPGDPLALTAAFVANHVAPAAAARLGAVGVQKQRVGPGAGNDDDAAWTKPKKNHGK